MKHERIFYVTKDENVVIQRKDEPGKNIKMIRIDVRKNPNLKNRLHSEAEELASNVEKQFPGLDYCLVKVLWDNGDWAVTLHAIPSVQKQGGGAMTGCTEVERVD